MNNQIIYHSLAEAELNEAVDFYDEHKPGLGRQFYEQVSEKLKTIVKYPLRYPKRRGEFRETPVRGFPFVITYRFNKHKKIITISAIHHASRNPKSKYRR